MLTDPIITAFLPTTKPELSKQFYLTVIGLQLVSEDNYALEFQGNGVSLRITVVPSFDPHPFTVLGFRVKEIESQLKSLQLKGVMFERYESFEQNDDGVWVSPSDAKIAWFKDPDGNLLSLTEYSSEK